MKKIFLPLGLFALIAAPSAGSAKLVLDMPPILAGASENLPACTVDSECEGTGAFCCGGKCYTSGECCGSKRYTSGFCCNDTVYTTGECCNGSHCTGTCCNNTCYTSCVDENCQPCPASSGLNDTGITWSGTGATDNGTTCSDPAQDCSYGWDKTDGSNTDDGHAGFKFTKLDSEGNTAEVGDVVECVRDERTGLIWEVTTPSATKTWTVAKTDATSFSACGKSSGWRLPTVKELLGIVLFNDISTIPVIDTAYFSNTASAGYWTSTEVADANATVEAWIVNFATAMTVPQGASLPKNVRLVHD